jgi:hypothetical protein
MPSIDYFDLPKKVLHTRGLVSSRAKQGIPVEGAISRLSDQQEGFSMLFGRFAEGNQVGWALEHCRDRS